jgi:hypothetical protein
MARKLIGKLEVYVDDDMGGNSSNTAFPLDIITDGTVTPDTKPWVITLNSKESELLPELKGQPLIETLAHELGHFAAQVMATPASIVDLKSMAAAHFVMHRTDGWQLFKQACELKYQAEVEAWRLAKLIYPGINHECEMACLASYQKAVDLAWM